MGGDEFCVLATLGAEHPETMIAEWALALSDQGDGFSITCAYGWCRLPDDAAWGGYRGGTPVEKGPPLFPRRRA